MTPDEFLLLQDYLVAALWPAILLWLVLFVAGGFMLALFHVVNDWVRERFF